MLMQSCLLAKSITNGWIDQASDLGLSENQAMATPKSETSTGKSGIF